LEKVPFEALHLVKTWERVEVGLGVHRFFLWWPCREVGMLASGQMGALWFVEQGQTMSQAAVNAAIAYWLVTESWPSRMLVRELPKGAPGVVAVPGEADVCLAVEVCGDLPKRFVLVV